MLRPVPRFGRREGVQIAALPSFVFETRVVWVGSVKSTVAHCDLSPLWHPFLHTSGELRPAILAPCKLYLSQHLCAEASRRSGQTAGQRNGRSLQGDARAMSETRTASQTHPTSTQKPWRARVGYSIAFRARTNLHAQAHHHLIQRYDGHPACKPTYRSEQVQTLPLLSPNSFVLSVRASFLCGAQEPQSALEPPSRATQSRGPRQE